MKEITRIHIAKVPYDAEVEAKKELEAYLRTLEAYSDDAEIINDIEIRITEILTERHVAKNGVVTLADVKALKDQLGEPKDFMGDGDIAIGPEETTQVGTNSRKLFRDVDNAIVGGVLSGIGAFFGVNPVWVRLLFIILALASFGTALLVYIVLWIVVPAAKTAADKLQMTGRSVTIASIRELNENEGTRPERLATGRRVLTILAGIAAIFGALGSMIAVGAAVLGISFNEHAHLFWNREESGFFIAAFVLAIVSGLLLVTLFVLAAYAAFSQKLTRRVIISSIIVTVMGLVTFGTTIGLVQYGSAIQRQIVEENTHENPITLPANIKTATSLAVDAPGFNVQYVVDSGEPRATLRVVADRGAAIPKMNLKQEGTALVLTSESKAPDTCYWPGCNGPSQNVTIYGPALQSIEASADSYVSYSAKKQSSFQLKAKEGSNVTIDAGTIDTFVVDMENGSTVTAGQAAITHVKLTLGSDLAVNLGTVESLEVTYPVSCPAGKNSDIIVWDAKTLVINGSAQPIENTNMTCLRLEIEGDKNDRS